MIRYRYAKAIIIARRWALHWLPVVSLCLFVGYFFGFVQGAIYLAEAANEKFVCHPR